MPRYVFDLDGTLCTQDPDGRYQHAAPIWPMIHIVRRLKDRGHDVLILTARGAGTGIDWRAVTEWQLATWGLADVALSFDKPYADVYIDDRAMTPESFAEWIRNA